MIKPYHKKSYQELKCRNISSYHNDSKYWDRLA